MAQMTEFEIKALELLRLIDNRLKAVEDFSFQEVARERAKYAALTTSVPHHMWPHNPKK